MKQVKLLDIPVDDLSEKELVAALVELRKTRGNMIVTANPEILLLASKNGGYKNILNRAALRLVDGFGLIFTSWLIGRRIKTRITGVDLVHRLAKEAAKNGDKLFLLGGLEKELASRAADELRRLYPGLGIVGAVTEKQDGQDDLNDEQIVNMINQARPDILLVAFGAPKQETWLSKNLPRMLSVKIAVGVGGTFDFLAKKVRRAPRLMRGLGLEWLWRVTVQPYRLSRIINATIRFPVAVLRSKYAPPDHPSSS